MQAGGFIASIKSAGSPLERVRRYIDRFAVPDAPGSRLPSQPTTYPSFPGLRHRPFHRPGEFPAAAALETAFPQILTEAKALGRSREHEYSPLPRLLMRLLALGIRDLRRIDWGVYPLCYMGVGTDSDPPACPATVGVVESLQDVCLRYPWGDALISVQRPRSKLPAHSSIDNLRVRCHLGIAIPQASGITVDGKDRTWQEGHCLLFEDSFVHEVWNDSDRDRVVLIVDLWHPDLTSIEREALTAGFRKREIRSLFMRERISRVTRPERYIDLVERDLTAEARDPLIRKYWPSA